MLLNKIVIAMFNANIKSNQNALKKKTIGSIIVKGNYSINIQPKNENNKK